MATTAAIASAAAAALPIPGASLLPSAISALSSVVSVIDPGKARDTARINRRDFFLNAAKAGSVLAARYLIAGAANVYTDKEKGEYSDGIKELQNGSALWQETLANAQAQGALWDSDVGNGNLLPVGQLIAQELGKALNVPADVQNVNQTGAIQSWASQFGYAIRKDTSQAIANAAAGVGAAAASAVAPNGSAAKNTVLLPTNKATLILVGVGILCLGYFAMRKKR